MPRKESRTRLFTEKGHPQLFFPELNEPARPTTQAPGERGADRATKRSGENPAGSAATRALAGLDHGGAAA